MEGRCTIREDHAHLEQTTLPERLVFAGDTTFPYFQIKHTLCIALRFRKEAKWMVSSPLLALLLESVLAQRHLVL